MSWLLLLLATHPDVQEKVREEAGRVLPPAGQPIEWQHLDQLTYLTAVIKETQRYDVTSYSSLSAVRQLNTIHYDVI